MLFRSARGQDPLGYVSEHSFTLNLKEGQHIRAEITADEDGDAPEYKPRIQLEVQTTK